MAEALTYLSDLVADQQTTIRDLRELMLPASTETYAAICVARSMAQMSQKALRKISTTKCGGDDRAVEMSVRPRKARSCTTMIRA